MATNTTGMAAHLAALDQRVTGLEQGVANVGTKLDALAAGLQNNSRTPWGVIWSACGVCFMMLTSIGALAYFPVREAQADMKRDLQSIVPRVEHERVWRWQERYSDGLVKRLDKLEERIFK